MHALRFDCLLRYYIVATLVRMLLLDTTMNFKLDSNSLITRKVWVGLGKICTFSENYLFCIFEASAIRFNRYFKGLRQYSRHMDNLWM